MPSSRSGPRTYSPAHSAASIGDLLSQPRQIAADADAGTGKGFGLGTTTTSIIFLAAILAVVVVMTIQQRREPVLIDDSE